MAIVICAANHKGGVGKSTTSLALAGAVLAQKRTCLLVDLDPQASITQVLLAGLSVSDDLGPRDTVEALEHGGELADVVRDVPGLDGLELLPARPDMQLRNPHLRLPLERASADVVLIDTAPDTKSAATMAGLLSSHGVVTPCTADMLGICTLPITLASLARAMAINPALVHLGFLITRYDHREMAQRDCEQLLRRTYGRQVLTTISPACAEFGQANSCRIPVQQFKPKGKAAKAAREIWAELTDRMADHHTTTRRKTA